MNTLPNELFAEILKFHYYNERKTLSTQPSQNLHWCRRTGILRITEPLKLVCRRWRQCVISWQQDHSVVFCPGISDTRSPCENCINVDYPLLGALDYKPETAQNAIRVIIPPHCSYIHKLGRENIRNSINRWGVSPESIQILITPWNTTMPKTEKPNLWPGLKSFVTLEAQTQLLVDRNYNIREIVPFVPLVENLRLCGFTFNPWNEIPSYPSWRQVRELEICIKKTEMIPQVGLNWLENLSSLQNFSLEYPNAAITGYDIILTKLPESTRSIAIIDKCTDNIPRPQFGLGKELARFPSLERLTISGSVIVDAIRSNSLPRSLRIVNSSHTTKDVGRRIAAHSKQFLALSFHECGCAYNWYLENPGVMLHPQEHRGAVSGSIDIGMVDISLEAGMEEIEIPSNLVAYWMSDAGAAGAAVLI
ncbi:hypothetical protein TWF281_002146 [Arthrobotrys megalospora]